MVGQRPIELQELSKYFNMPEKAVAKSLGICLTSLKKICRQHGVTRWPYRKIKSLDKKLRKLEVAMSTAKDDPSMVFAKWGEGSGDTSPAAAASPPCSDDASFASTPRQMHDFSPSPDARRSPVEQPLSAELRLASGPPSAALSPIPVRLAEGHAADGPLKIELSLTPSMLQSVATGGRSLSFVVEGVEGLAAGGHATASFAPPLLAAPAADAAPAVKAEPAPEELSDDEIIAMLAMCAGTEAPAQPAGGAAAAPQMELSDAEIMQALAGCCEAPSSFSFDRDESAHASDDDDGGYMAFEAEAFDPFTHFACGAEC